MKIIHGLAENVLFKVANRTLGTVSLKQTEQEEALGLH